MGPGRVPVCHQRVMYARLTHAGRGTARRATATYAPSRARPDAAIGPVALRPGVSAHHGDGLGATGGPNEIDDRHPGPSPRRPRGAVLHRPPTWSDRARSSQPPTPRARNSRRARAHQSIEWRLAPPPCHECRPRAGAAMTHVSHCARACAASRFRQVRRPQPCGRSTRAGRRRRASHPCALPRDVRSGALAVWAASPPLSPSTPSAPTRRPQHRGRRAASSSASGVRAPHGRAHRAARVRTRASHPPLVAERPRGTCAFSVRRAVGGGASPPDPERRRRARQRAPPPAG